MKKKVLIIAPYWDKTFHNKNIGKLLNELQNEDVSLFYYCESSTGDSDFKVNFPNINLLNFMDVVSLKGFGLLKFIFNTLKLILVSKPDLVFWTYAGYKENIFFTIFRIPYVLKMDSILKQEPEYFVERMKFKIFYEIPAKKAFLILSETEKVKNHIDKITGKNSFLFPNGVPIKKYKKIERSFLPSKDKRPYFLFTGRIMREKGIDLLLASFRNIMHLFEDWELKIVGPIIEHEYFALQRKYIEINNMRKNVSFLSFRSGYDLYELYYHAEFYVLPSRHEGLPNRLTEAMYFINPVIAFDVNQVGALITDKTGELIKPFDVQSFSENLKKYMLDKNLRKTKGVNARGKVISEYDDEKLWPQVLKRVLHFG